MASIEAVEGDETALPTERDEDSASVCAQLVFVEVELKRKKKKRFRIFQIPR